MYEKTYQLKCRPFSAAPNLQQYHPTDAAEQALRNCRGAIDRQAGPAVIFGGVGTGKTLLLSLLAEGYGGQFQVVTLACARTDTRKDLLQAILFQIGQNYRDLSESELRLELADYLRPGPHCPQGLLCLVDDAHCLTEELMDELRVLAGIIRGGQLRFQLVLTGDQRLEEMLGGPRQESFNQKIATRSYLHPMSQPETAEYVQGHLRRAGGGNREFFTPQALKTVHRISQGLPRLVNQLCDAALQRCHREGAASVTPEICEACWSDLQKLPRVEPVSDWQSKKTSSTTMGTTESSGIEFGVLTDEVELNSEEIKGAAPIGHAGTADSRFVSGTESALSLDSRRADEDCEGRSKTQMSMRRDSMAASQEMDGFRHVTYPKPSRTGVVESLRSQDLNPACDLDPDCPEAMPQEGGRAEEKRPVRNPFEEQFETEEVVTEAFVRSAIAHNRAASELTRQILDEYQVDSLCTESLVAGGMSISRGDTLPENSELTSTGPGQGSIGLQGEPAGNYPDSFPTLPESCETHMESDLAEEEVTRTLAFEVKGKPDDRDMLIVSRLNQQASPAPSPLEELDAAEGVSTGRAYRMDYKQLFSRLRNSLNGASGEATSQR